VDVFKMHPQLLPSAVLNPEMEEGDSPHVLAHPNRSRRIGTKVLLKGKRFDSAP
jgi:hypothetical protein